MTHPSRDLLLAVLLLSGCASRDPDPRLEISNAHADAVAAWTAVAGVDVAVSMRVIDAATSPELVADADARNGGGTVLAFWDGVHRTGVYYVRDRIVSHDQLHRLPVIARHEVGHALGVPHLAQRGAVMAQDGLNPGCVTQWDAQALDAVWGRKPGTAVSECELHP